ncbi:hypothetical protein HZB90_03415 [archaeon]|nr:hypothetical protein [archaeon]
MSWARHYKRKKSAAKPIVARIQRKEEMAKKRGKKESPKVRKEAGIPPEKYFVLRSGATIKDLKELALMLDRIDDSDFTFHVNDSKNDFACWIDDVFGRKDIADAIRSIKDKRESQIVLLKQLFLEKARYDSCSKEVVMDG